MTAAITMLQKQGEEYLFEKFQYVEQNPQHSLDAAVAFCLAKIVPDLQCAFLFLR